MRYMHEALSKPAPTEEADEDVLPFEEIEKRAILDAIRKCDGDISKASRKLGLSRATIYRQLSRYGISQPGESSPRSEANGGEDEAQKAEE